MTTAIGTIQGSALTSPLVGQTVTTSGVVTMIRANTATSGAGNAGFYLQDPVGDGNASTSDGIFVFTRGTPTVKVGDAITLSGTVGEFTPGSNQLSITQLTSPTAITVTASNQVLPTAVTLGQTGRAIPSQPDNDQLRTYQPADDAIDFYESLEGMLVAIPNARVVRAPNDFSLTTAGANREIVVVPDDGATIGTMTSRGGPKLTASDINTERLIVNNVVGTSVDLIPATVGHTDLFTSPITGVMDYNFSNYRVMINSALPAYQDRTVAPETTSLTKAADKLTVANFNVLNLSPNTGDPTPGNNDQLDKIASAIVTNLKTPDIIALQEIQDNNGSTNRSPPNTGAEVIDGVTSPSQTMQELIEAIVAQGGPRYAYAQVDPLQAQDGGIPGGNIRNAFLYDPTRVSFTERGTPSSSQAVTVLDGEGGAYLATNPGRTDGYASALSDYRRPLVGEFSFNGEPVWIINVHFSSKGGDTSLFGSVQPPTLTSEAGRIQQINVMKDFIAQIQAHTPQANIITLGDFNDFEWSAPLQAAAGTNMTNLINSLQENERFSYNFQGNAQVLDNLLISNAMAARTNPEIDIVHIDSEYRYNSGDLLPGQTQWGETASDHDPVLARFTIPLADNKPYGHSEYVHQSNVSGETVVATTAQANTLLGLLGVTQFQYQGFEYYA